jgi:hypothetical protein
MRVLLPSAMALLVLAPLHAQEATPVGAATIQEVVWPNSGQHAREFAARGVKAKESIRWTVSPRVPGLFARDFPGNRRIVIAGPPGTYTLTLTTLRRVVGKLDKPLSEFKEGDDFPITDVEAAGGSVTFTLRGSGPAPIPPDPLPPDPKPPEPTPPDPKPPAPDALTLALKTAAAADGWTAASLARLGAAFRAASAKVQTGQTASATQAAIRAALVAGVPEGIPASVYAVCAGKLSALDTVLPPSAPNKVVNESERAAVRSVLEGLAIAAEGAAK